MGIVYLATQVSLDRQVAVKVLPKELATSPDFRVRFEREAKSAAKLRHPNIVQVYAYGITDGSPWFAMEFVEGKDIFDRKKDGETYTFRRICEIGRDVALALDEAHRNGFVHRDIKPSNIMINSRGHVLVMDFGLARAVESEQHVTQAGTVMGTPRYMSPEQATGAPVDSRSDLYSLGMVLYELVTGQMPFQADTLVSLLYHHVNTQPAPVRSQREDVPPRLAETIERLLAKKPEERYQVPAELAQLLDEIIKDLDRESDQPTVERPAEAKPDSWANLRPRRVSSVPELRTRPEVADAATEPHPRPEKPHTPRTSPMVELGETRAGAPAHSPAKGQRTTTQAGGDGVTAAARAPGAKTAAAGGSPDADPAATLAASREPQATARPHKTTGDRRFATLPQGTQVAPIRPRRQWGGILAFLLIAGLGAGGWYAYDKYYRRAPHPPGPGGPSTPGGDGGNGGPNGPIDPTNGGEPSQNGTNGNGSAPPETHDEVRAARFREALAMAGLAERVAALEALSDDYPRDTEIAHALEEARYRLALAEPYPRRRLAAIEDFLEKYPRNEEAVTARERTREVANAFGTRRPEAIRASLGSVRSVAFAPSGVLVLATGGQENRGAAGLWQFPNLASSGTLAGHTLPVACGVFSRDGQQVFTGSGDGTLRVFQVPTGRALQTFAQNLRSIRALAMHPQGTHLATAGRDDGTVQIWDIASRAQAGALPGAPVGHGRTVRGVAFGPDGALLVTGSDDRTVRIWSFADRTVRQTLQDPIGIVNAVAFSPDGQYVAAGGQEGVRVYQRQADGAFAALSILTGRREAVNGLAFNAAGTLLATAGNDQTVRLYAIPSGEYFPTQAGHTGPVRAAAFSPSGDVLATAGDDDQIIFWNVALD